MPNEEKSSSSFSFNKGSLLPQEEMLEVGKKQMQLTIGIPRESHEHESRVALTPEAVEILVNNGHQILIESNAGKGANYSDSDYSECGGFIIDKKKEILKCDIILKVAPFNEEEIDLLKGQQVIITSLDITTQKEEYIRKLMNKKVTALAFETIRDQNNAYPVTSSMSEIVGNTSVLIAAEYLSNVNEGKGVMLGGISGITPTEVIILGAGTAAEFAVRAAKGLGAFVKVIDNSVHKLRRLQTNLGFRLHTSVFHPQVLEKALKSADVLIAAMYLPENGPRFFVTEDMVKGMKKGAVIVDISIDQGGCIETSERRNHKNPVFTKHGVIHYCVPNIAARVARTASIAISNVFAPILLETGEYGGIKQKLKDDIGLRNGVYIYNGILTNSYIGNYFGIPSKDIDLLIAAF